jgi:hypothetical protein
VGRDVEGGIRGRGGDKLSKKDKATSSFICIYTFDNQEESKVYSAPILSSLLRGCGEVFRSENKREGTLWMRAV